jgi:hypothetical protein
MFACQMDEHSEEVTGFMHKNNIRGLFKKYPDWNCSGCSLGGMFATSLDMFVHVLATHDTSCKWLCLLRWL